MRYIALCLTLAAVSPLASADCLPILGTVQLTQDPGCTVMTFPGMRGQPFVGECYKDVLKLGGMLPVYGYSGVTSEAMTSMYGGSTAATPASVQGSRTLLTARSTLTMGGTRIYAAEVIISSNNGDMVTEQSVITGTDGKGLFKNATGGFTILGNSVNDTAQLHGKICTP
jgi:hypothetical protein